MKNRLKVLRAERDWTQAQLASELEVSRQTVNAIEKGKFDPSLPLAFKAASGLISGTTNATSGCMRKWPDSSMTVAPAATAAGRYSAATSSGVLAITRSTPANESVVNSSTT